MQPYMPEETLKRMMLLENQNAELELQAQQMDDAYKRLQDMLFKADQRIAELERKLEEMEVDLNTAEDLAIHGPEGI